MSCFKVYKSLTEEAAYIRTTVFVREQGFADEFDDTDKAAEHIVMYVDGDVPAATCRYYWNEAYNAYSIGRIAVLKQFRGRHFGAALLREAEERIRGAGGGKVVLAAQRQAQKFYEKQGYAAFGDTFFEEHCAHIMMVKTVMTYAQVQSIARQTIDYLKSQISAGMSLSEIRRLAEDKMLSLGATSFWYWDVGAFVFAGEDTVLSVSGKHYITADRLIAENDIITVDLSPQAGDIWGDFARTIIIENERVVETVGDIFNDEWREGLQMEDKLHGELILWAAPDKTFEELYFYMNDLIAQSGYVNLDFMGNLGHSIERRKEDRIYIEKGNTRRLGDVNYFTFEPHISRRQSVYGYKKENIYFFENGILKELE